MTIKDLIPTLGIKGEDVEDIRGNQDLPIDKGYSIKARSIKTFRAIQSITIYPYVDWTDGSCRPCYTEGYTTILLNRKLEV